MSIPPTRRLLFVANLALSFTACSGGEGETDGTGTLTEGAPPAPVSSGPAEGQPVPPEPALEPTGNVSAPPALAPNVPSDPPVSPSPEPVQQPGVPAPDDDVILAPEEDVPVAPGPTEACASENAAAELEPVVLAFAFDVSGSMGKGDEPYHDRTLKWDPVVTATKAFFDDPASVGLSASLSFFPIDGDDKCDAESYLEPVVALTALPSPLFGEAIDSETPAEEDDWIGGTPTWAVLEGTYEFLQTSLTENPEALHAIVLVTDGYPQGCDDEVEDLEALAEFVAGYSDVLPTYVIGVDNPVTEEEPDPPDVVTNLNRIAERGGTGSAFIVDTDDESTTATAFAAAVDAIRGNSLSCTIAIPEPPSGQTLDTDLVNVSYEGTPGTIGLVYSEDCSLEDAWQYDDPTQPTTIQLCEDTCTAILADGAARIAVEFGCVRRTTPVTAR